MFLVKYSERTKELEPQSTTKNKRVYYRKWTRMEVPYTSPFTDKGKARKLPLVEAILRCTVEHHTNQEHTVRTLSQNQKEMKQKMKEGMNRMEDSLTIYLWLAWNSRSPPAFASPLLGSKP